MRAVTKERPRAAVMRARRAWKDATADVYRSAIRKHGTASSWLKDAGGTRGKIVKGADQLARLVAEMHDAGFTLDQIDARLVEMTRGICEAMQPDRPAA